MGGGVGLGEAKKLLTFFGCGKAGCCKVPLRPARRVEYCRQIIHHS